MPQDNVRLHELLDYIRQGKIMEAMHEFYADNVVMEEPKYGRTEGLPANLEREQQFVDSVAEFVTFETPAIAVGDNVGFYQNVLDWKTTEGGEVHLEQTVVQTWNADGKITHERFYYDNSGG